VEHLFFQISTAGEYEFWITQHVEDVVKIGEFACN